MTIDFDYVRTLVLGGALLGVIGLEHLTPHAAIRRPLRTNLGLWLIDSAVMRVTCGACGFIVAAWCEVRGIGLFRMLSAPSWLGLALSVIALDGVSYGWHRANHRVGWLWSFHRVHHADRAYQVTTALRFHPGELLLALPIRLVAIAAVGVSPIGVLIFEVVFGAMNLIVHGNFDLPRRLEQRLAHVIVTPALHRLHHARNTAELNSNYGTVFSIFDRLLGTLRWSDSARRFETGLPAPENERDLSLGEALTAPFTRRLDAGL